MAGSAFRNGAAWYDALSGGGRRLEREGNFLLGALSRAGGARRVLDTACGTGVHALFFAEHGASVAARDLSPDMIDVARQRRPHPGVNYAGGDMRHPPDGPWDLILCLGNSLSLLPAREDAAAFFRNSAAVLAPEGRLVVQVLNYALPALRQPRTRVETATLDSAEVRAEKRFFPEEDRTGLEIIYTAARDGIVESHEETAWLNHWDRALLESLAGNAGLCLEECLGGYDGAAFDAEKSGDLIMVWRRE